ncbi:MAG: bL28 family ribosomal protein [Chloroflexota bacterium]
MAKCEICSKAVSFGRNIRHQASGGWARRAPKTNRTFKANVQKTTVTLAGGVQVQMKVCTRCLRTLYNAR